MKPTLTLPNGEVINYALERRARKTIGLKITQHGLVVHAPKRILSYQLAQVLAQKSAWIQKKLALYQANQVANIEWQHGETLWYLGQEIQLVIAQHNRNKPAQLNADQLSIFTPTPNNEALIERKVLQWYKKMALLDFAPRLEKYAAQLGVATPPLTLSNARTRWGSCNSVGQIRLSWRLIQASPEMIDYVICHELAHLKELNHSPQFYAVLSDLYPQHRHVEKALKKLSPQLHRL